MMTNRLTFVEAVSDVCILNLNINFRYNQLAEIPKSLSQCVNMMEFNVENNNISELPVSDFHSSACKLEVEIKFKCKKCDFFVKGENT